MVGVGLSPEPVGVRCLTRTREPATQCRASRVALEAGTPLPLR
jgi:hypothetical protein